MITIEVEDRFIELPSGRRVFDTGKVLIGRTYGEKPATAPRMLNRNYISNTSQDEDLFQSLLLRTNTKSKPLPSRLRRLFIRP